MHHVQPNCHLTSVAKSESPEIDRNSKKMDKNDQTAPTNLENLLLIYHNYKKFFQNVSNLLKITKKCWKIK